MLKKILIGFAVLVVVLVVVVAMQPSKYHVERSAEINAPADVVWAEVANFQQWKGWSHWEKMDPEQKTTITGEPGAVGHASAWQGEKTGKGTMTIAEINEPNRLVIDLQFNEPMESKASNAIDIAPKGDAVEVKWSMDGENNFAGKMFGMMMDMDEMIGGAFENSLADLKVIAEKKAKEQAEAMAAAEAPAAGDPGEAAAGE